MKDIRANYFKGSTEVSLEPIKNLHAIADGSIRNIGHLFAASIYNRGPAPNFLAEWVYNYIIHGLDKVLETLPPKLEIDVHGRIYDQVYVLSNLVKLIVQ